MERPGLEAMLDYIRERDTLIALSMDRLARNSDELKRLVNRLTGLGITVRFIKEQLIFTGGRFSNIKADAFIIVCIC
jgi:DNA invertase Pin-like site-specific DNA recombinase